MSTPLTLIARNECRITLVYNDPSYSFLDADSSTFIGRRFAPERRYSANVVEIIQNTAIDIPIKLLKPDGTAFDLTGCSAIIMGIFQLKPLAQNISLTAGSVSGAAVDGLLLFSIPAADTDFDGFAEGSVKMTKNGKPVGFDSFQVVYRRDIFLT